MHGESHFLLTLPFDLWGIDPGYTRINLVSKQWMNPLNGKGAGIPIVASVERDVCEVSGEGWGGKSGHDEADEREDVPSLPTWAWTRPVVVWSNQRAIPGYPDSSKPRHIAVAALRLEIRL